MPGATPNRGYPYPLGGEAIQVSADMQAALDAVDADVTSMAPIIRQVQRTGAGPVIANNTGVTITSFNTTLISVGSPVPTYSNGAYTIPVAGVWEARLHVRWPAISAAHRTVATLLLNGNQILDGSDTKWYPSGTTVWTYQTVTAYAQCAAGDLISQDVLQDSGSSQTIVDGTPVFSIRRIG